MGKRSAVGLLIALTLTGSVAPPAPLFRPDVPTDASQVTDLRGVYDAQATFQIRAMAIFRRTLEGLALDEQRDQARRLVGFH